MFSWYVAHVFSEWLWNSPSRPLLLLVSPLFLHSTCKIIIIIIIIVIILQCELTTTAPYLLLIMSQVCNLRYFCVPEYRVALMQGWWKYSQTCGDYTVDQTCCNDHETRMNCIIGWECKKQFAYVCKSLFFLGWTFVDLSYNYYVNEQSTRLSL